MDESRKITMLPKACLDKGVLPTRLAPITPEDTVEETAEIVERVKESNRQSSELDKFRQIVQTGESSR